MAIDVQVLGVGLLGPGLASWDEARPVLKGELRHASAPTVVPAPQRLPAAERRRAGAAVKIAMAVADAACSQADIDPQGLATVFTSSNGDGANCHALLEALASTNPVDRLISPTRFTNSVHNAASGYWHITVAGRQASTSLCAHDESFSAGLVAALTQVHSLQAPVLLVASDSPYPEPLHAVRPLPDSMGVALLLAPPDWRGHHKRIARLAVDMLPRGQAGPATRCTRDGLEALRTAIPAARALPLLQALAQRDPAEVVVDAQGSLALKIRATFG